ncbi:hypothetical protein TNCV_4654641 [Trichonephila clavipes]|nr:hypothetical protein TNCV_4654641 [Trichonephila clavipes]
MSKTDSSDHSRAFGTFGEFLRRVIREKIDVHTYKTIFPGHFRYASANLDLVMPVYKHNSLVAELRSAPLATIHERYPDQNWLHVFTDGSATASFDSQAAIKTVYGYNLFPSKLRVRVQTTSQLISFLRKRGRSPMDLISLRHSWKLNSSLPCNKSTDGKKDFRVVKIEAELILEANRLQLMKQDLEKAENAYLSSFTSKKSKTLPGATAAAHGDPNGKNDYQKKGEFDKGLWVLDTAATSHFCNDKSLFLDLKPITNMKMSLATEDKSCPVEGIGTLRFRPDHYIIPNKEISFFSDVTAKTKTDQQKYGINAFVMLITITW